MNTINRLVYVLDNGILDSHAIMNAIIAKVIVKVIPTKILSSYLRVTSWQLTRAWAWGWTWRTTPTGWRLNWRHYVFEELTISLNGLMSNDNVTLTRGLVAWVRDFRLQLARLQGLMLGQVNTYVLFIICMYEFMVWGLESDTHLYLYRLNTRTHMSANGGCMCLCHWMLEFNCRLQICFTLCWSWCRDGDVLYPEVQQSSRTKLN